MCRRASPFELVRNDLRVLWKTIVVMANGEGFASDASGGGGIRTHGALARPTAFKAAPFDRSGTPPERIVTDGYEGRTSVGAP